MSEFADRFFGAIVIILMLAFAVYQGYSRDRPLHVYSNVQIAAMKQSQCRVDYLLTHEGEDFDGLYDQAESHCRAR